MILTCTTILILSQVCRKFKTDRQKSNLRQHSIFVAICPCSRCRDAAIFARAELTLRG